MKSISIPKTSMEFNLAICFWLWAFQAIIRMDRLLTLFFFSFWIHEAFSGEVPTGVVKWLETSSRYIDMECKARKVDGLPSTNFTTDLEIRVIFESGDYWERSLIKSVDFQAKLERSYVNGIERAFQHWNETEKQGRVTPEQQGTYGFIETSSWDDRRDSEFLGMSLGYRFGRNFGVWKNLSDFAEHGECEAQAADSLEEEVLLFKDVGDFGPSNLTHYDIRATLAKRYQHLATKLEGIVRVKGEPNKLKWVHSFEDFKQISGRWIPTKIYSGTQEGFGRLVTIELATVKLNSGLSPENIELKFLKGQRYFDALEKRMYIDGKPVEPTKPTKSASTVSTNIGNRIALIASGIVGGILLVLGILLRRRNAALLLFVLLWPLCILTGCSPTSDVAKGQSVLKTIEVLPASTQNLTARIDSGRVSTSFKLVNRSEEQVIFDSNISATCGCPSARLTKTSLAPNEECEVVADIDIPKHSGSKLIQLVVRQQSPTVDDITLLVDARFEGDWGVETDMLVFRGKPSETSLSVVKLFGSEVGLNKIKLVDYELFCSIVKDERTKGGREIVLSRKIGNEVTNNVLGDLRITALGMIPSEIVVRASEDVTAPGKWTPRAISLKPGEQKTSEFKLEPGFHLASIAENEQVSIEQVPDPSNSVVTAKFSLRDDVTQDKGVLQVNALIDVEGEQLKLPLFVLIDKE